MVAFSIWFFWIHCSINPLPQVLSWKEAESNSRFRMKNTLTTFCPISIGCETILTWFTTCLSSFIHYSIHCTANALSQSLCIAEAPCWTWCACMVSYLALCSPFFTLNTGVTTLCVPSITWISWTNIKTRNNFTFYWCQNQTF